MRSAPVLAAARICSSTGSIKMEVRMPASLNNLIVFSVTFFLSICWFIPTFIRNALISVDLNQWTSDLNFHNVFQLFVNYFGVIPIQEDLVKIGVFAKLFIITFLIIIYNLIKNKKDKILKITILSSVISFSFFLLAIFYTGNSLLYPRTAICLVLAFYLIFANSFTNFKHSKVLITLVIILQLSQFFLYYNQDNEKFKEYFFVDYKYHPIKYFTNFDYPSRSCLISIPVWNTSATKYYIKNDVKVLSAHIFKNSDSAKNFKTEECDNFYLLEQTSLGENSLRKQYKEFMPFNYKKVILDSYANQNLYLLSK